jgi:UDP-N-acetylglucosamine 4,6-dehydratase/5-epimerase
LLSREEISCAEDMGDYFRVPPDLRDLNYAKYVEEGDGKISRAEDYNSHNTQRLDLDDMQKLLLKMDCMQAIERGENVAAEE